MPAGLQRRKCRPPVESVEDPSGKCRGRARSPSRGIGRSARLAPGGSAAAQGRLRDVLAPQAEPGELGVAQAGQGVVAAGERQPLVQAVGEIVEKSEDAEPLRAGSAAGRERQGGGGHRGGPPVQAIEAQSIYAGIKMKNTGLTQ